MHNTRKCVTRTLPTEAARANPCNLLNKPFQFTKTLLLWPQEKVLRSHLKYNSTRNNINTCRATSILVLIPDIMVEQRQCYIPIPISDLDSIPRPKCRLCLVLPIKECILE